MQKQSHKINSYTERQTDSPVQHLGKRIELVIATPTLAFNPSNQWKLEWPCLSITLQLSLRKWLSRQVCSWNFQGGPLAQAAPGLGAPGQACAQLPGSSKD